MLFKRLSCTFRGLSCTPQLTATQSLVTAKKHYKTRATQRNSLQLTRPEKQRKNDAELQPAGCVRPGQQAGGTESAFFWKAGCFFAATGSCAFASFSLYVVLLALKCVQQIVSKSIKILIAALRCVCRFAFFLLLRDSFATLRFGCDSVAALRFVCCFAIRLLPCDSPTASI